MPGFAGLVGGHRGAYGVVLDAEKGFGYAVGCWARSEAYAAVKRVAGGGDWSCWM